MNNVVAAILIYYTSAGGYGDNLSVTRFESMAECRIALEKVTKVYDQLWGFKNSPKIENLSCEELK